jgi:hypothetical protein
VARLRAQQVFYEFGDVAVFADYSVSKVHIWFKKKNALTNNVGYPSISW